jgi:hypothetical protein
MSQSIFEKKATEGRVEYVESLSETDSIVKQEAIISTTPDDEGIITTSAPSSPEDIVKEVLSLADDPTLNPWTFRMWFIGTCLSVFAA